MITASPALITLLNSGVNFVMADIYTIGLTNGSTLYYTTADIDLTVNGSTFKSTGMLIKRNNLTVKLGIEVDTLDLTIIPDGSLITNGLTLQQAINLGVLDRALVKLERAFMPSWASAVTGTMVQYVGWVAKAEYGRSLATVTVKSILELLNTNMPRNLVQANCSNTLFDSCCGLTRAAWGISYSTVAGSTSSTIITSTMGKPTGYYELGVIQFTSGKNAGLKRTIRTQSGNSISTILPLPNIPAIGDTFTLYAGCNKTKATCQTKFSNLGNFRGCPYVPMPEVVY